MNVVGYWGLLQAFADALKLLLKEYVGPTQANPVLFFIAPMITLIFSLLGYAVIPYGSGLSLFDFDLGVLFVLAVSSLSAYGILLAGWSANSKYAFLGSKWPIIDASLYLKQTISEKLIWQILPASLDTLRVTPLKGSKVKTLLKINNSQVTKAYNSLVGTSETIRLLSEKNRKGKRYYTWVNHPEKPGGQSKKWNQWLAGLIDGDGSFYLNKKGYASLEITMDIRDEHALHIVKNVYGGSVKLVSGEKALRYCLRHKQGFLSLIKDVNGEIRNSYRIIQLNKICLKYDISFIFPNKLTYENGWFSGFFDADGCISINNAQPYISLTQKYSEILQPLIDIFGGSIYIDRTNHSFKWYTSNKQDILKLIEYFKNYPSRSGKKKRLCLVPRLYELRQIEAHIVCKENSPLLAKAWKLFRDKWNNFS